MGALSRRRGCWAHRALLCASATTLLCVALLIACLATATARGHVFEKTFSEPCAAEPCEGKLKEPDGVAVNEATGDLYVVDKGANRVARYDQAGNYLGEFNGSGKLENSKKELFEETEAGAGGKPGETGGSGSNPGERGKATGRFEKPEGIAVDNACRLHKPELSGLACEAFDPSNGDVYVVDASFEHRVIDKYDPEGKYLGQLTAAGAALFKARALDGVAVDPQGGVWVLPEAPAIYGFTNGTVNEFTNEAIAPQANGFIRPGFAVDGNGDFYVAYEEAQGGFRVAKLDHTGKVLIAEVDGEESAGVAVEQTNDDSLIENLTSVGVFDPEGRELERLGAGQLTEGQGIGVNGASGFLYVADAGAKKVLVFAPKPVEAPLIEDESFSEVSAEGARLAGIVNPRSEAGEAETEYEFQYGRCATASSCAESPYEASTPPAKLPADFESHPVSAEIAGLTPSATYHFRLLAKNAHGPGQPGAERAFKTEGAGGELILPDNRGFELVSPPDKKGASIEPIAETGVIQAAAGGGAITYLANTPTEAEPQGYTNEAQVLSRRASASWSSRDIAIPHSGEAGTGFAVGTGPEDKFFDRELNSAAVQPLGRYFPLSVEASESTAYLHDLSASCGEACFHPLVTGKPGFSNVPEGTQFGEEQRCLPRVGHGTEAVECGPLFANASEDLSHVLLGAQAPLVSGAGEGQLYEWAAGKLAQASVLPRPSEEPPAQGVTLGLAAGRGSVSADGTRVAFSTAQALYLRDMSRGETVQLDKLQAGCEEGKECTKSGGGRFQSASADGSRIFFTDTERLTKDSGAEPGGQVKADLYECQITVGEGGKLACALSDLTPSHGGESAAVQGGVLGASTDGSYLYFVAEGIQSEGKNARGEEAIAGQPNLYVRHGEQTSFIATLAGGDEHDWEVKPGHQPTRVSESGRFLALMSERPLSGYDNRDVASGKPAAEVYEYDAVSKHLSCASCDPTGARPVGVEYLKLESGSGGLVGGNGQWPQSALVAANVPGWTAPSLGVSRHQPRYLNDTGRLFFNSANALVPQDANGTQDVYEYEPAGVGSCEEASSTFSASAGGCIALISSGSSAQESAFLDASESGDDVFFLTSARLSPLDVDAAFDVYDAHVCSSALPCIEVPSAQPPPCSTEASCKASPTPQPSIFGAPASATFQGPGNPPPPAPAVRKEETKSQKLAKALKACHAKKDKHKRKACERAARRKYGAKAKAKAKRSRHQPKRGLT